MPESFIRIRKPLKEIIEEKQLWEICVKRTDDAFGFATGRYENILFYNITIITRLKMK